MSQQLIVKIALLGNAEAGKTSLMVRYVEGEFNHNYIQSLGVNFMERTITLHDNPVLLSIWDLGGESEFKNMLPLVCDGSMVFLYIFDLTSKTSLASIKEWYRQAKALNRSAFPVLVGAKYDRFRELREDKRKEIIEHARRYSKAMKNCPLVFTSAELGVNINRLFKLVVCLVFGLNPGIEQIDADDQPIFEYTLIQS
ncbi:GTP-binding protein TEM1 [Giardia duodenalis assemblage B]|uniref:GTP-binding protein TEM1 n=3 Tax=Giardia intestinalis TaxID=5741 RepID=A0A132NY37_GIAIN|nr:Tem-1-like protein [Giardia intestinalis ATCC 50581]ESU44567.1 GTP-binding protein TEM1 [Giardia intestinalis]KWX14989.1 GTP-binding protein TEM1 [Giardia intestinalis assemblage B]